MRGREGVMDNSESRPAQVSPANSGRLALACTTRLKSVHIQHRNFAAIALHARLPKHARQHQRSTARLDNLGPHLYAQLLDLTLNDKVMRRENVQRDAAAAAHGRGK